MKKYQVINFHHLLSQIDLQKVDKEARSKLISLDIILGDIVDEHNAEIEKVKARLSKGHEDAIAEVSALMSELQVADEARKAEIVTKIDSNTEYATIQNQLNEEVNKRLVEDVNAAIEKVASADLAQWCADSGISITLDLLREFRRAGLTL
jgi:hypothetical protein